LSIFRLHLASIIYAFQKLTINLDTNAFGLDDHEIDDDINAAIAELEVTNPDISLFMNSHAEDSHRHKGGSKGTVSTNSMTATSTQCQRQAQHTQAVIPSILDREISVASSMTKSSNSDI